mmetsp:Transcript_9533/g.21215  ORF Transcript_9533/g.21215 Transcript_9533/m.21215 type:complete len:207 (+) Transcript_9533:474-1094(+)
MEADLWPLKRRPKMPLLRRPVEFTSCIRIVGSSRVSGTASAIGCTFGVMFWDFLRCQRNAITVTKSWFAMETMDMDNEMYFRLDCERIKTMAAMGASDIHVIEVTMAKKRTFLRPLATTSLLSTPVSCNEEKQMTVIPSIGASVLSSSRPTQRSLVKDAKERLLSTMCCIRPTKTIPARHCRQVVTREMPSNARKYGQRLSLMAIQ